MMPGLHRLAVLLAVMVLVTLLAMAGWLAPVLRRWGFQRGAKALQAISAAARVLWALGVIAFLYARLVEADWLAVTQLRVAVPRLAAGRTYQVAVVSDLHVESDTRALIALRDELRARPADLVVFTGDAINRREAVELFRATMVSLGGRLGRAAVRGNHDVNRWGDVELFSGVATPLGADRPLLVDDAHLALCGADFGSTQDVERCLAAVPEGALSLFVYHSPDLVERLQHRPDVYVAGHTHGGQVRLPFYGALITFSDHDKKYESGRYDVKGTTLVVSRGVGFEPGLPRVRFLCRPELVRLELVGTGPAE